MRKSNICIITECLSIESSGHKSEFRVAAKSLGQSVDRIHTFFFGGAYIRESFGLNPLLTSLSILIVTITYIINYTHLKT